MQQIQQVVQVVLVVALVAVLTVFNFFFHYNIMNIDDRPHPVKKPIKKSKTSAHKTPCIPNGKKPKDWNTKAFKELMKFVKSI